MAVRNVKKHLSTDSIVLYACVPDCKLRAICRGKLFLFTIIVKISYRLKIVSARCGFRKYPQPLHLPLYTLHLPLRFHPQVSPAFTPSTLHLTLTLAVPSASIPSLYTLHFTPYTHSCGSIRKKPTIKTITN